MAYALLNIETLENVQRPSQLQLATIDNHTLVKLGFKNGDTILERMWVRVDKIEDDQFTGVLINCPSQVADLSENDTVTFQKNNIIGIMNPRMTYECKC
ncbi:DUF2314 domain-containing protein [Agrilactobacillus yilanensis]|uniref:DUF2314 domain-containing protein n=1 Tax=Agrilactobacillus yilanensis TaxID=2485997 RepID=A0ABW4JAQ6_9LACO|nr:DUF2314 domain-containing protein [Agrilactobacillus yilanensis]